MGQQQQLLIVLGTLIVFVAISMGIKSYQENADSLYLLQIEQDLQYLAVKTIEYYKSPEHLGGGGNSYSKIQSGTSNLNKYFGVGDLFNGKNSSASYKIISVSTSVLTIQAEGLIQLRTKEFPQYTMTITGSSYQISKKNVQSSSLSSSGKIGTRNNILPLLMEGMKC